MIHRTLMLIPDVTAPSSGVPGPAGGAPVQASPDTHAGVVPSTGVHHSLGPAPVLRQLVTQMSPQQQQQAGAAVTPALTEHQRQQMMMHQRQMLMSQQMSQVMIKHVTADVTGNDKPCHR